MKNQKGLNQKKAPKKMSSTDTVEVLYQKMGDRWFAFSMKDDEVFVGSISQQEIDESADVKSESGSVAMDNRKNTGPSQNQ